MKITGTIKDKDLLTQQSESSELAAIALSETQILPEEDILTLEEDER